MFLLCHAVVLFGFTDVFVDDQREAFSGDMDQVFGKG
jgi:hypothetical protein